MEGERGENHTFHLLLLATSLATRVASTARQWQHGWRLQLWLRKPRFLEIFSKHGTDGHRVPNTKAVCADTWILVSNTSYFCSLGIISICILSPSSFQSLFGSSSCSSPYVKYLERLLVSWLYADRYTSIASGNLSTLWGVTFKNQSLYIALLTGDLILDFKVLDLWNNEY